MLADNHEGLVALLPAALRPAVSIPRGTRESTEHAGDAGGADVKQAEHTFGRVYEDHFDFVWRTVSRLGVPDSAVADVCQEVFIVVYRRLDDFEPRAALKTWLFAIVSRTVLDYRRRRRRKGLDAVGDDTDPDVLPAHDRGPDESADTAQKLKLCRRVLEGMDDEKRALFVLSELEQWTVPEIAEACGLNVNTVYTRLRAARAQFEQGMRRHRARSSWSDS